MHERAIYITDSDANRLRQLFGDAKRSQYYGSENLRNLGEELNRATVVASTEVPRDVIAVNSKVQLVDLETS
ncbi:MAG TPA: hypothetical protein VGA99_12265 [bacterium]